MVFSPPLKLGPHGFGERFNLTLHGRSIHRCRDVPGHNVFKGYSTWERTGKCVGDALDCFAPAYTPVYAMHDGVQTRWRNDTQKLEVIYIESRSVCTVYAHINARFEGTGITVKRGDQVGAIRWDLRDPHLHLEVWPSTNRAVSALTPAGLAEKLADLCVPAERPDVAPWAEAPVAFCKERGIMGGYPDGSFRGYEACSRQELACTIHDLLKYIEEGEEE